jgi:hypothetical protein
MLLIPLALANGLMLISLVAAMAERLETRRLEALIERLPELSEAEFNQLLAGLIIPDGTLPPPLAPIEQRQAALLTWLEHR